MKTLEDLNRKWWYRFLKVIFGISFFVTIVIINVIAFSGEIKKVDLKNTIIECNRMVKESFSAQDINLNLRSSNFSDSNFDYKIFFENLDESELYKIFMRCYGGNGWQFGDTEINDVYTLQKAGDIKEQFNLYRAVGVDNKKLTQEQIDSLNAKLNIYKEQTKNAYGAKDKIKYLDYAHKFFDVNPVFSYSDFLKFFLTGNLIALCIFEALRRLFYYIVLGKINP